jgi:NAD-dependent SIR2 family protein deacetylase
MDLALGELSKDFIYKVEFANIPPAETRNQIGLIKLHGSLNWFYCETCQEVQLADIRYMVENLGKAPYPVIGICTDCGGQSRGLLVPPLAMKFDLAPPLTPLVGHAETAFGRADLIVVIGFSFAEADVYISRMLSKSMQTSPDLKLLVVDPDRSIADKVRRKFKASIPNFDTQRIMRATEDCATFLPKFLDNQLKRDDSGSPEQTQQLEQAAVDIPPQTLPKTSP